MELNFRAFTAEDFPLYQRWYEDAILNASLGPMNMNDEWLTCVLNQKDAIQYSVFLAGGLVAVVGVQFPSFGYPFYCITDLAIKPALRGQGIGSLILQKLLNLHQLQDAQTWRAFVDVRNPEAKLFFEKNDWKTLLPDPDSHGMVTMEYCPT